jgi:hypothetical protein
MSHHWRNQPDIMLKHAFNEPERIIGCLVCDVDHGTPRVWGGQYNGKLPRVTDASIIDI